MKKEIYSITGTVEIFNLPNPWIYIRVPKKYTKMFKHLAVRGLIPITAFCGTSTWDTSLLPMGDGTHFIALNAKVRKAQNISVGDRITVEFSLRNTHKSLI